MAGGRRDGLQLDDDEQELLCNAYAEWGGTKPQLAAKVEGVDLRAVPNG